MVNEVGGRRLVGKRLPVGTEDFKQLITEKTYYIDKTLFIRDLQTKRGNINLFLRPRRFGKTLTLSMLKYFYEDTGNDEINAENKALFDGLKISYEPEEFKADMSSYPVISLSLKSGKQPDYLDSYKLLRTQIANEYERHIELLKSRLDETTLSELTYYERYFGSPKPDETTEQVKHSEAFFKDSLHFLSKCLFQAFEKKVIVLIDEYDVPLESAYFRGYYNEMIDFIRTFFETGLKTNPYIEFAVITGCLRVSRESLFTGFNNLSIISMANNDYSEFFGFTQAEIDQALLDFEHPELGDEMRRWYNGYRFGKEHIYNPWSVVNCLKYIRGNEEIVFRTDWANSSGNDIIKTLIDKADKKVRTEVEILANGGSIEKQIHEDVTYAEMLDSDDNLFNFLYFTGYLTAETMEFDGRYTVAKLIVPNLEVMTIYDRHIMAWFDRETKKKDFSGLYNAIEEGDCETIAKVLSAELRETISYMDYDEKYYHGFFAGLLAANGKRIVRSNRESGLGRYDLSLVPDDYKDTVIIIEVKSAQTPKEIESKFQEAENQVRTRNYEAEFESDGYTRFSVYATVFFKKSAEVRLIVTGQGVP